MAFWSTVVLWPTTDQNNHSGCQIQGWPLCKSPVLLRKDLQKWLWQILLLVPFVQNFSQPSVLYVFPFKISQCFIWNKGSCSRFLKCYLGLVSHFFFKETIIVGFNLLPGTVQDTYYIGGIFFYHHGNLKKKKVISMKKLRFGELIELV